MVDPVTTTLILLTLTLFCVGLVVGWVISNQEKIVTENKIKSLVAIIITLGWISATISGILVASYTVSPFIHALMGAIVGYFFTDDGITLNIGGE